MSRNGRVGSLKGKDRLAECAFSNIVFQRFCRGQVHRNSENVRETVFHVNHVQQRKCFGGVKFGQQIHIRLGMSVASRQGAEKGQSGFLGIKEHTR